MSIAQAVIALLESAELERYRHNRRPRPPAFTAHRIKRERWRYFNRAGRTPCYKGSPSELASSSPEWRAVAELNDRRRYTGWVGAVLERRRRRRERRRELREATS